jgi:hypothetical protein
MFDDIRGVVSTPGGLIVVADGGSAELRVFSDAGRFVRAFGGRGDGPREFRDIAWIDMCWGTTVVAYDGLRYRITKWGPDGSLEEEISVVGPGRDLPPYAVSCGSSGMYVVVGWPDVMGIAHRPGPYRPLVAVGIADQRGRVARLIGEFPGTERLRTATNDRPHPFGKPTIIRMHESRVYVGTADSFAIQVIRPDQDSYTIGSRESVPPLSPRMRERWVDAYVMRAPREQRELVRTGVIASEWLPATAPAYSDFLVDRLGFVWISPFVVEEPGSATPVEWWVYAADGTGAARILIPSDFRPTEIGPEYVLGVGTDALGVERVRRYDLAR